MLVDVYSDYFSRATQQATTVKSGKTETYGSTWNNLPKDTGAENKMRMLVTSQKYWLPGSSRLRIRSQIEHLFTLNVKMK